MSVTPIVPGGIPTLAHSCKAAAFCAKWSFPKSRIAVACENDPQRGFLSQVLQIRHLDFVLISGASLDGYYFHAGACGHSRWRTHDFFLSSEVVYVTQLVSGQSRVLAHHRPHGQLAAALWIFSFFWKVDLVRCTLVKDVSVIGGDYYFEVGPHWGHRGHHETIWAVEVVSLVLFVCHGGE